MKESLFENSRRPRRFSPEPPERPASLPGRAGDGALSRLLRAASRRARTRR